MAAILFQPSILRNVICPRHDAEEQGERRIFCGQRALRLRARS
jgi:hypothetical protein